MPCGPITTCSSVRFKASATLQCANKESKGDGTNWVTHGADEWNLCIFTSLLMIRTVIVLTQQYEIPLVCQCLVSQNKVKGSVFPLIALGPATYMHFYFWHLLLEEINGVIVFPGEVPTVLLWKYANPFHEPQTNLDLNEGFNINRNLHLWSFVRHSFYPLLWRKTNLWTQCDPTNLHEGHGGSPSDNVFVRGAWELRGYLWSLSSLSAGLSLIAAASVRCQHW